VTVRSHLVPLTSASGLSAQINANGSLRRIDHCDVIVNLFPGNEIEGGPTNLYLRRRGDRSESIPLLGPRSPARYRIRDVVDFEATRARLDRRAANLILHY
jgi:hypothetical protein